VGERENIIVERGKRETLLLSGGVYRRTRGGVRGMREGCTEMGERDVRK